MLILQDGWGIREMEHGNAVMQANTPNFDRWLRTFERSIIDTFGEHVGLIPGQMGNSEVGHMNIGGGRIVYQELVRINKAIDERTLHKNEALLEAVDFAKKNNRNFHLIGLVSDGGVHSHIYHLKGLCDIAKEHDLENFYIHAFTDGRDTDPKSGVRFIKDLQDHLSKSKGKIASITGRYYAMDRDKRWERVKLAYDALVKGEGKKSKDLIAAIQESYQSGATDEFIKPIVQVDNNDEPVAKIQEGDVVLCFNFRTDRGRQITQVLTQKDFPEHDMHKLSLKYLTLTKYDDTFQDIAVLFEKDKLKNTLGEWLSKHGKKQIRIAETEKYPHVTFFFSGGREEPFQGEQRILCPSPKVATYDLKPEMSACEIRDRIVEELKKEEVDFVCLNFANPDMVGHTGVFEAAVKACETVDSCTKDVMETALSHGYSSLIIADHGNSDMMINEDGTPNTAHTTNLVPCILVDKEYRGAIKDGKLGDLAPTILQLMGLEIP